MEKSDITSIKINRLKYPPSMQVRVPGSKSMTNRALLLAALADGVSVIDGVQFSDDSSVFLNVLEELGFEIKSERDLHRVTVKGLGGRIPKTAADIYTASAGTAARFITAFLGVSEGRYIIRASEQMSKRPMRELYDALRSIGTEIGAVNGSSADRESECESEGQAGQNIRHKAEKVDRCTDNCSFPISISGNHISQEKSILINLNIDRSSQFLSGLLMVLPLHYDSARIHLTGKRDARSYVSMTVSMMKEFGFSGNLETDGDDYIVTGGKYRATHYQVEPDVSAACYFYALAAVTGGTMSVSGVKKDSLQGDMKFLNVLEKMGCIAEWRDTVYVTGPERGRLKGFSGNMSDMSDQALTLAAIAPFADSPVKVSGVEHIRKQESDRIAVIDDVCRRLGIQHDSSDDSFTVYPLDTDKYISRHAEAGPIYIDTYNDHRVAMSFTVTALKLGNIVINDPMCCRKTFADYYDIVREIISEDLRKSS